MNVTEAQCNQVSSLYLLICPFQILLEFIECCFTVPSAFAALISSYTGLSLFALNCIYRIALCVGAIHLYSHCKIILLFHKNPVKIPYVSPISKKLKEIPLDSLVSMSCRSFRTGFTAHPFLLGGNLQTLLASLFADFVAKKRVVFERELISAPDGGIISLDWTKRPPEPQKNERNVYLCVCHGLTGGSHETYVQELAERVKIEGCSDSPVKTPLLYSGSYTDDVDLSIKHIKRIDPSCILIGVGYSLGSNVITKFSGQKGFNCPFIGMVSVGNPYDFLGTTRAMHRSFIGRYLYSAALSKSLIRMFSKHANVFKNAEWLDMNAVLGSKTIQEFDTNATIKQFGYATVHEYYRFGSCAQDIGCLLSF